jgi:hypothetical protein
MGQRTKKSVSAQAFPFTIDRMSKLEHSPSLQEIFKWSATLDGRAENFKRQSTALADRLQQIETEMERIVDCINGDQYGPVWRGRNKRRKSIRTKHPRMD